MKTIFIFLINFLTLPAWAADLSTKAERTNWRETGRYEETLRLCADFEKTYPEQVKCLTFGNTPEGRPMVALVVAEAGYLTPAANHDGKRPIVFFQGGIHAGEIDGKDAGFWFLRSVLNGKEQPGVLKKVTLVFVPVFNVDGHERFGKWNRPNQVGPAEMGWRVTSQNLNLNRDYVKAESPEMGAMLGLLNQWDPIVCLDLHVTDGANFQPAVGFMVEPLQAGTEPLLSAGKKFSADMMKALAAKNWQALPFYPSFVKDDEPYSGVAQQPSLPRFSHPYWAARNRIGVLVETHSWKNYATRVRVTYDAVASTVGIVAKEGAQWLKAAAKVDEINANLAGKTVVLDYDNTKKYSLIDFPGYQYKREYSLVSAADRTIYDPTQKETWKIPLYNEITPSVTVVLPQEGYIVTPGVGELVKKKLDRHGIQYRAMASEKSPASLEVFRADDVVTFAKTSFEGLVGLKIKGKWTSEKRLIPPGSLFVPIDQPKAILIAYLFEPLSPESFVSWGFFDAYFETKESMESYVTEEVAREMLKDPKVKAAFEKQLEDPEFAGNPNARLDFFYRRHPSYDDRLRLYPIFRR